eukprot:10470693-Ditylum_brightwellii.AAC.1
MLNLKDLVKLTKGNIGFYTFFECDDISLETYKALAKLSDVPAECVKEGVGKNDKFVFFVHVGINECRKECSKEMFASSYFHIFVDAIPGVA